MRFSLEPRQTSSAADYGIRLLAGRAEAADAYTGGPSLYLQRDGASGSRNSLPVGRSANGFVDTRRLGVIGQLAESHLSRI